MGLIVSYFDLLNFHKYIRKKEFVGLVAFHILSIVNNTRKHKQQRGRYFSAFYVSSTKKSKT